MLHVQGATASLLHPAASHLLPGTVMVLGALLIYKVVRKSRQRTQERQKAEDKQSELEQKLENLQAQYDSLKKTEHVEQAAQQESESTKTNNVTPAATPPTSGRYALFDKIIKENMAIREAANA